jgi:integrase
MPAKKREKKTRRPRGFGSIEQRGPTSFRVRLSVDGKRVYETIEAGSLLEASNAAAELRRDHERQARRRRRGVPVAMRIAEALAGYRKEEVPLLAEGSQASYKGSLVQIEAYFVGELGNPKLADIDRADVKRFMRWRARQKPKRWKRRNKGKLSVRTVARDFRVLRRLFRWATEEMQYLDSSPVTGVKEPKTDDPAIIILDAPQYERLLEKATAKHPMFGLYVLLLGETGCRAYSEALSLRWEDVDLAEGFLHLVSGRDGHRTKSGKSRYVPMTDRLLEAMRAHFAAFRFAQYDGKQSAWVFHHTKTRRRYKAGAQVQAFKGPWQTATREAKLPPGLRLHDLRHRRVTTWLAEGKPTALVQKAMGHHSITVTEKYFHLVPQSLRALVQAGPSREELRRLAR